MLPIHIVILGRLATCSSRCVDVLNFRIFRVFKTSPKFSCVLTESKNLLFNRVAKEYSDYYFFHYELDNNLYLNRKPMPEGNYLFSNFYHCNKMPKPMQNTVQPNHEKPGGPNTFESVIYMHGWLPIHMALMNTQRLHTINI